MWYASNVINADGETIQQQAKGIHEVIDLVKTIPDKVLQSRMQITLSMSMVVKKCGNVKSWEYSLFLPQQ